MSSRTAKPIDEREPVERIAPGEPRPTGAWMSAFAALALTAACEGSPPGPTIASSADAAAQAGESYAFASGDDAPAKVPALLTLAPMRGEANGKTVVTLQGEHLDAAGVEIWFGSVPAQPLDAYPSSSRVVAPPNNPGWVDVRLMWHASEVSRLTQAFVYEDVGASTGSPDGLLAIDDAIAAVLTRIDTDGDGIDNAHDPDVDGDGIPNGEDDDIDGDGVPNGSDTDADGDGVLYPFDDDDDGDGIPDDEDPDADGDGEPDDPAEDDDDDDDCEPEDGGLGDGACADDGGSDAEVDAGSGDGGVDAGSREAGVDAGGSDSGRSDAGNENADAGSRDGGSERDGGTPSDASATGDTPDATTGPGDASSDPPVN